MHPAVRYGTIALVVLAVLLIGFGTRSETLLLADVADALAKHQTVRFESKNEPPAQRRNGAHADESLNQNRPPRTMTRTVYATLDRMHVRSENPNGTLTILDRAKGVMLFLDPNGKTALISKFPGKPSTTGFLEILDKLEMNKKTKLSVEKLEGTDMAVFRLTDKEMKSTIWADPKTKLPVRVEMEQRKGPRQKSFMTQFVWDPEIADPDQFFSVEPPASYTVRTRNLYRDKPPGKNAKR